MVAILMPCSRDEFVRLLWLSDFEHVEDLKSAQLFRRAADGAEVFVPKRASVDDSIAIASFRAERKGAYPSPCCNAESRLRGVFHGVTIMRCGACQTLWQRATSAPALRLVP